jgi:outer membrane cobalamin receptor
VTGQQIHTGWVLPYLTLLLLWVASDISGQHLDDTIHLGEVRILHKEALSSAGMISSSMDSTSIEQMQGRSLSELLGLRSSLHIKSTGRGGLSTASFRGTDASHTKVFWNGIRINSPMTGQVDFSLIPVLTLDKLTLLYGSSSLSEGSGAFGGAVVLESQPDWQDRFSLVLNQEIGSFGTYSSSAKLAAGNAKIRAETSIYRNSSVNNYLYFNTGIIPRKYDKLEGADYRTSGILQEIYYRPSPKNSLTLHFWYQDAFRNLPSVMSYEGSGREEFQKDRNLRTSFEWSHYAPSYKLVFRSGYLSSGLDYNLNHLEFDYSQYDTKSREKNFFSSFQAEVTRWESTRLMFRFDLHNDDARISDRILDEGYHHTRREVSLMAGLYQQLGENFMLYAMLRQERADRQWVAPMPSTGFRINLTQSKNLKMKGSLSRNYNIPSLNDLYWIPGGNPDLKPEKGINADLGLSYKRSMGTVDLTASANIFGTWIQDWIIWRPTVFRYWEAENLARVFSRGFESGFLLNIKLDPFLLNLNTNYTYTLSTNETGTLFNEGSRGTQLVYIPKHTGYMHLKISRAGYSLSTSFSYTGRRHTQPSNEISEYVIILNPYMLSDLYLCKELRLGKSEACLQFSVQNLFNVSYEAVLSRPMPLRNYSFGIRWKI